MKSFLIFLFTVSSTVGVAIERPNGGGCANQLGNRARSVEDVWEQMFAEPEVDGDVDRYLEEAGAEGDYRSFQSQPGVNGRGKARLVIAVSPQTYPIYLKYFGGRNVFEQLSFQNNTTYNRFRWQNEIFLGAAPVSFPPAGTLGLPILLSDTEAARLHEALYILSRYPQSPVTLGNYSGYQYPFQIPGYGFPEAFYYNNCAAWPAYLMVGDKNVSRVCAPGNLDADSGASPLYGTLTRYDVPANIEAHDHDIFTEVFSVPGHEPLWEMLGFPLREGDFTASGWMAHTLLGRASTVRLPIVVYYTDDHTREIPNPVNPNISLIGPENMYSGADGMHR